MYYTLVYADILSVYTVCIHLGPAEFHTTELRRNFMVPLELNYGIP